MVEIFRYCTKILNPGCRLCINLGDRFQQATKITPYQIIPLHARLINAISLQIPELIYLGSINWKKVTTSNTSGGGKIMGSVYHPRNGYFFVNYEYIAVFKKKGKDPKPNSLFKEYSKFTLDQRREWFKDSWQFAGVKQNSHIAMFPDQLPYRLIRMHSFVGDTVLDPFLGSGTTSKVAAQLGRHSIGFELGFESSNEVEWKQLIKNKVIQAKNEIDKSLEELLEEPNFSFLSI